MNSFIVKNIEKISDKEMILTLQIGKTIEDYIVEVFPKSVSFPEPLDLLLMDKDFNYHKEFLKIISDYKHGLKIKFPITLFDKNTLRKKELQVA